MALALESSGFIVDTTQPSVTRQTTAFTVGSGGRLIVVKIGAPLSGNLPTVSTVTDSLGNTYAPSVRRQMGGSGVAEIWAIWSTASGSCQVTVTFAASPSGDTITANCWSGAEQTIGATAVDLAQAGPAEVTITPQAIGSVIEAAGFDYNSAASRTVTSNATLEHESLDAGNDTSWTERLTNPTTSTSPLTIGTTAPTLGDSGWGMCAVEVRASSGTSLTGAAGGQAGGSATLAGPVSLSGSAGGQAAGSAAPAIAVGLAGAAGGHAGAQVGMRPYVLNAVDPIEQPPNATNAPGTDTAARPLMLCDNTPGAAGDLFGLLTTYGSATYLLVSANRGISWSYLTPTGTAPANGSINDCAIAQDTSASKIHYVTFGHSSSTALYHRGVLSHDESGHITGLAWEAVDQVGPAFDGSAASNNNFSCKLGLQEVVDGNGTHVLVLGGLDRPTANRVVRLVAAKSTSLAPTGGSSWTKLDGTSGYTVICAKNTDTGVDGDALLNLTGQPPDQSIHESDFAFAQLPEDKTVHFFFGGMFYNDRRTDGDIRRFRFTSSGAAFNFDMSSQFAPENATASPQVGNCVATQNYVWFTWGDVQGVHVSRVNTANTFTYNAIASPDTTADAWFYSALSVGPDETKAWLQWERWPQSGPYSEHSAYWNGSSWATYEDTSIWSPAGWDGASVWCPIVLPNGVGVLAYDYADWAQATQHWHAHVAYSALESALSGTAGGQAGGTAAMAVSVPLGGSAGGSATAGPAAQDVSLPIAGAAGGQAGATGETFGEVSLSGSSGGQAGGAAAPSVSVPLGGSAGGTSTAGPAPEGVAQPLDGSAGGQAGGSAEPSLSTPLAGSAGGTAGAGGLFTVSQPLSGAGGGQAGGAAGISVSVPLAGVADGTSSASATPGNVSVLLGEAGGYASSGGAPSVSEPDSGSGGQAEASGTLGVSQPLSGVAEGHAAGSGDTGLQLVEAISGSAGGQAGVAALGPDLGVGLTGASAGLAGGTGAISGATGVSLSGAAGGSAGAGTEPSMAVPMVSGADGHAGASGTMGAAVPLSGASDGVGGGASQEQDLQSEPIVGGAAGAAAATGTLSQGYPIASVDTWRVVMDRTSGRTHRITRLDPKMRGETEWFKFDFSGRMSEGEEITHASITMTAIALGDGIGALAISGSAPPSPFVHGATVSWSIGGGAIGAQYQLDCTVTTSSGQTLIASGQLKVVS